jgi:hypothetical protein
MQSVCSTCRELQRANMVVVQHSWRLGWLVSLSVNMTAVISG